MMLIHCRPGFLLLLVAFTGLLGPGSMARVIAPQPQTPEEILADCIEMIDAVVADGEEISGRRTEDVIRQIADLRGAGAEAKKIGKAAARGKKSLAGAAKVGLAQINRITGSCMARMRRIGADRELNSELLAARAGAITALRTAAEAGAAQIDAAGAGQRDDLP